MGEELELLKFPLPKHGHSTLLWLDSRNLILRNVVD